MRADLLARATDGSYAVRDVAVEAQQTLGDGSTVFVVSHTMADIDGADFTNYAAIRIPQGADNLPVLIINHGGDQGFSLDDELALLLGGFPSVAAATSRPGPSSAARPSATRSARPTPPAAPRAPGTATWTMPSP